MDIHKTQYIPSFCDKVQQIAQIFDTIAIWLYQQQPLLCQSIPLKTRRVIQANRVRFWLSQFGCEFSRHLKSRRRKRHVKSYAL